MITAVILNWKRPANVARILAGWRAGGIVSEAIVWNNNAAEPFHHDWAKVINAAQDLGLYTRFAAACLAAHECVLIQDDDLEVPEPTLHLLHEAWCKDADVVHGLFGRVAKADGSYDPRNAPAGEAPVVLCRGLLTHRKYVSAFFATAALFAEIQSESAPRGNGEDILFSYTAQRISGRPNRIHRLPVSELPAPHSIHGRNWSAHLAHRSRLMRACEAWLRGESPHENRRDLLHV